MKVTLPPLLSNPVLSFSCRELGKFLSKSDRVHTKIRWANFHASTPSPWQFGAPQLVLHWHWCKKDRWQPILKLRCGPWFGALARYFGVLVQPFFLEYFDYNFENCLLYGREILLSIIRRRTLEHEHGITQQPGLRVCRGGRWGWGEAIFRLIIEVF